MKKTLLSLLPAFLLSGGAAFGQLYVYDGFSSGDYTDGVTVDGLGGGSGWSGNWSVDASANANNINRYHGSSYSLDYTDSNANSLVTNAGGLELKAAGSGAAPLSRDFTQAVDGELWFSFLNIRTSTHSWGWDLQFLDAAGGIQFRVQNASSSGYFRINQGGATSNIELTNHTTDPLPEGQFFVGRVTNLGSGSANSSLSVWANPNNLLDLDAGAAATASLTDRQVEAISRFGFVKGANHTGYFDEFRVGGSLDAVAPIPEPATYAAWLGLLSIGLLALRRRRASGREQA